MRYRRPNRRKHKPFPPKVQITALLLGPWTWFVLLVVAGVVGWTATLFLYAAAITAVWVVP
jgi:hypothetical protein